MSEDFGPTLHWPQPNLPEVTPTCKQLDCNWKFANIPRSFDSFQPPEVDRMDSPNRNQDEMIGSGSYFGMQSFRLQPQTGWQEAVSIQNRITVSG